MADKIRAGGMSVSVEESSAKMVEFYGTVQERHVLAISEQADAILRQNRIIQEFDGRITTYRLVVAGLIAVSLLAIAEDLGWL